MPISRHLQHDEAERLLALRSYGILDSAAEPAYDDLTALAASLFRVPIALVTLVDEDRQWFKSGFGVNIKQTSRAMSFCDHAIRGTEVLVVEDATLDPRFAYNPMVTGPPGVRFYAGAPLLTPDGFVLGTLCVLDSVPHQFSTDQCAMLQVLSRQVLTLLELRKQNAALLAMARSLELERDRLQRTKLALHHEQQLNQQIVDSSPIGICIFDADGPCISANPAAGRQLGATTEQLRAQNFHRISSWQRFGIYELALNTLQSGLPQADVVNVVTTFGRNAWLGVNFVALDAGGVRRLMIMMNDLSDFKLADQLRREAVDSYKLLFTNSMDGVLQTLPDGRVIAANPAACKLLRLSEDELCNDGRRRLIDRDDTRLAGLLEERERVGRARGELTMVRGDGERFEAEISSATYHDAQGRTLSSVVFRDITERLQWRQRLEESVALLHNLAQRVPGTIFQHRLGPDGRFSFPFASAGMWDIYELSPEELREDSTPLIQRVHPADRQRLVESILASAKTLQPWQLEYRVLLPKQGERWREGNAMPERASDGGTLWHGVITDITERKQAEAHTNWLAYFDSLTGLPNRRMLLDRIEHDLALARRLGQIGALLFVDLDHFKHINDALGHSAGDQLLKQVAQRFKQLLRDEDTVARLGGDEFVVLLSHLGTDADAAARHAMAVAEKLRALLERGYDIDKHPYNISGSIGITLFPKLDEKVEDLLREADTAMYRAKSSGRNRIAFFESSMHAEVQDRLALEQDLKRAIGTDELSVHVQPQFDTAGQEIGGELLLRWKHPLRGHVSPMQFIPVAEESGLILELGDYVLRQACEALAQLHRGGRTLPLSVNVSPRQFRSETFITKLCQLLGDTGAPADSLILEVTEGLLIDNLQDTIARMTELVSLGIRFSIDDFGTGYSSLAYLKKLPLYELKIDKSFVQDTPDDPSGTAIVEAILSMATHLQLRVVAEGVETQPQSDFLAQSGCECMQGYLFARPGPLAAWLGKRLQGPP